MSPVTDAPNATASLSEITNDEIFAGHLGGKLSVELSAPLETQRDLSIAYTPGVAQVSRAIAEDVTLAKRYTWTDRLVVVVSDGTAVLGLGDIGPRASLPVMEGKAALFKKFAGLDSIPIVLDTKDVDEIVETLIRLRPSFGAVNLEDISAPAASRSRSESSRRLTARSCTTTSTAPPSWCSPPSTVRPRCRAAASRD